MFALHDVLIFPDTQTIHVHYRRVEGRCESVEMAFGISEEIEALLDKLDEHLRGLAKEAPGV